jgi:hypothetical protein
MTTLRTGLYVWVTWLSRLMVGDTSCQWATWFRTHYTGYKRTPSDFQLSIWTVEHTQFLDKLSKERSTIGERVYREGQNYCQVRQPSGLTVAGKPDLVTIDNSGHCSVYDVKTGNPRQSDIIQVMLYMMMLPYGVRMYRGKCFTGCVVYKDSARLEIPARVVNEAFQEQVAYFLNILESPDPPERTPSSTECRFCDITTADCSSREEFEIDNQ